MQRFFGRPSQPPVDEQVRSTVQTNDETLEQLQRRYDDEAEIIEALGENIRRMHANGNTQQATVLYRKMQRKQRGQTLLAGKIETLSTVSENVHDMHANVSVHQAIDQSNVAFGRIAQTMDVDKVEDSMNTAVEHGQDHREVSELLAGSTMLDPIDEDEMMASLDAFVGNTSNQTSHQQHRQQDVPVPMASQARRDQEIRQAQDEARMMRMLASMPAPPAGDSLPSASERAVPDTRK